MHELTGYVCFGQPLLVLVIYEGVCVLSALGTLVGLKFGSTVVTRSLIELFIDSSTYLACPYAVLGIRFLDELDIIF